MKRQSQKNKDLILHIQTKAEYIWYLNGLFEGYDGLAVVRTIDKEKGILELLSTTDQEEDIREVLRVLSHEIDLVILD